jgi:hypothetical protein
MQFLLKLLKKSDGKKAYATALAMAVYAILGLLLQFLEPTVAYGILLEASAVASLRRAL